MKKTRALPVIALVTALTTAVTGCGTGGTGGGSAPTAVPTLTSGAAVTGKIVFWHAYSAGGPEVSTLEKIIIPAFEKLHPGVTVQDVQVPSDSMHQKLVTAVAGSALPDVIRADIVTVPELAKLGVLTPLDAAMPDFQTYAKKMYPGPLATNKYKGKYYGLPLDTNTKVTIYNKAALAADGITSVPKTLDELKAAAAKAPGKYIFAEGGSAGWNMLPFIWSNGGEMTNADVTKSTGYLNGPKSVAALQMLIDMYQAKAIPQIILGGTGGVGTSDGLAKGIYPTIVDGPWTFPNLATSYKNFQPQTAPMFSGAGGSISVVGGEDIVMTQQSQNKTLAAEFIRYMLSDEAQLAMGKAGQLSAISSMAPTMASLEPFYQPFLDQLKTAKPRPATPQWAKIDDIFTKQTQLAFQGKQSAQAAMDAAVAQIDPLLAQG
ncbi:carbohydrate ABC transporter substrate-binding protein, CUT1 family [Nakamurella panacisegetis]|uniref:Carbohydrate ABC transporter substrate-binding protein, CUT1 family n=1 Tax=Nakamurella panacisegetis TaxID=1090615 RepID=A0A1H0LIG0_9ACTN|nr:extracellular solute-binding protein [Nakamurella panacisegetis]SDO67796.1 carbohydrate ABC transporter substrate-binding protein, CUT1 family [Nakamurella panacisegetis]